MGYDGLKGDSEGLGLEIQESNVEQKNETQYRMFEPFLPIVPEKLNFWALYYFEGLKYNGKQTTQGNKHDNNIYNNNTNNNIDRP